MCIDQGFIQILQYQYITKWILKMGIMFFCWKHKAPDKYVLGLSTNPKRRPLFPNICYKSATSS